MYQLMYILDRHELILLKTYILRMIEIKQNGRCFFCKERVTRNHAIVSSGRPRHYYHKNYAIRLNVI
jgi:isoprenylcysteine carboxyl methyltransferase (ICMT) family protein YpbQ